MIVLVALVAGAAALASIEAARRQRRSLHALDSLGEPVSVEIEPGTDVVIHDLDDLRLVGDLSAAVGPDGSVTLGRSIGATFEVVCVRWHPRLAPELSRLHASLGGLVPTVLIGVPRWSPSDIADALGVLSEWGYRVHRVERTGPFRRNDREWLVATSDRRIGLERQREDTTSDARSGRLGSNAV